LACLRKDTLIAPIKLVGSAAIYFILHYYRHLNSVNVASVGDFGEERIT
jgi:hypothetical protein